MTLPPGRRPLGPLRPVLLAAAATTATVAVAVAYLAFLGWHAHKDRDPVTGVETGPYEPWQVIGYVAVLALLAFAAGWLGRPWLAVLVVPVVGTACFAADAATDPGADGMWPVGAALVAIGSLAGTVLLAGLGALLARRRPP